MKLSDLWEAQISKSEKTSIFVKQNERRSMFISRWDVYL